jgi:hypothetical protein
MNDASVAHGRGLPAGPAQGAADHKCAGVRWLARIVLAQARTELVANLPAPWLASDHLQEPTGVVRDYVLRCIAQPQAGSKFEARTRSLRELPDARLLAAVRGRGYDGLIYPGRDAILGHVFFQRRGTAVHAFATAVNDAQSGRGCSAVMLLDYLAYACQLPGITQARVGTGRNNVTRRLLSRVQKHAEELGWCVRNEGWVRFAISNSRSQ